MEIINARGALTRTAKAVRKGELTVGFMGGSITAGHPTTGGLESNWPYFVRGWLLENYPDLRLTVCNSAIGANGTLGGLSRAERRIIKNDCDLVFIECVVNDGGEKTREQTQEGLIRRLLKAGCDVVLVYTFCRGMQVQMMNGEVPPSIMYLEKLADHYGLSSVWSGKHALDALNSGRITWEGWLPASGGTIHPDYLGSFIYSEPVTELLKSELVFKSNKRPKKSFPASPLRSDNFETMYEIPMSEWKYSAPWCRMQELRSPDYDFALYTSAIGATLRFEFDGRAIAACFDYGRKSGGAEYRIDGGEWKRVPFVRAEWVPERDWCATVMLEDDLENKRHAFELRTVFDDVPFVVGSECKIFSFAAVR